MLPRRLTGLLVLTVSLGVSGVEPQPVQPPTSEQPGAKVQLPAGWVKDRLGAADQKLDAEIKDLVGLYQRVENRLPFLYCQALRGHLVAPPVV